jgi:hypothetical protein
MWIVLGVVALLALAAGTARAETFKRAPREALTETWRGKTDPPAEMQPRPKFRAGDAVIDSSTGKPKARTIDELAGSKGKGGWSWIYYMTDGSGAAESALTRGTP